MWSKEFLVFLIFLSISTSMNAQGLNAFYSKCLSDKGQVDSIIEVCHQLEDLFIDLDMLNDRSPKSYLILSENLADKKLKRDTDSIKQSFNEFEIRNHIEIDLLYYDFLECMYLAIVENKTSVNSTNFIQYETIKEINGAGFSYVNFKAMINYAARNGDFSDVVHRIPLMLGIMYYVQYGNEM